MSQKLIATLMIAFNCFAILGCSDQNGKKLVRVNSTHNLNLNLKQDKDGRQTVRRPRKIKNKGIKNKDLGILKEDFTDLFKNSLSSIDPGLTNFQIENYDTVDIYQFNKLDYMRVDYRKSTEKESEMVQEISLSGFDRERFSKVEKALFEAVFPSLTDTEYMEIRQFLYKQEKSESGLTINDMLIEMTWSETIFHHKYIALIQYESKRASSGTTLNREFKLLIQPE